ncbi:hypothetical protein [Opitutus terrae]|nr:hypothetical protein [Opitutus terrae]
MSLTAQTRLPSAPAAGRAVLWGGLLCGVGDLSFAFVYYGLLQGLGVVHVMQSVAGGLLGRATYSGAAASASLGVALHFLIAFIIAAIYVALSRKAAALRERPFVFGALYGAGAYVVMQMIVLPLSAWHSPFWPPNVALIPFIGHIVLVGLPIALATRRFAC